EVPATSPGRRSRVEPLGVTMATGQTVDRPPATTGCGKRPPGCLESPEWILLSTVFEDASPPREPQPGGGRDALDRHLPGRIVRRSGRADRQGHDGYGDQHADESSTLFHRRRPPRSGVILQHHAGTRTDRTIRPWSNTLGPTHACQGRPSILPDHDREGVEQDPLVDGLGEIRGGAGRAAASF